VEAHIAAIALAPGKAVQGMRVRASYRLEDVGKGPVALRQGPVTTVIDSAEKSDVLTEGVALLLRTAAEEVFPQRLSLEALPLPSGLESLGPVGPAHWRAEAGWITMAWNATR
jgi:hypothetical protein